MSLNINFLNYITTLGYNLNTSYAVYFLQQLFDWLCKKISTKTKIMFLPVPKVRPKCKYNSL